MAHKRNGRAARLRRQEAVQDRQVANKQFYDHLDTCTPEERLIVAIFGVHEECQECHASKLVRADCMTPHCKALRDEPSVFYDEVTEDQISIKGATMYAGVDY